MGLKDKMNAALERVNAGRQAKLGAKSDVAYGQGNLKKGAKLEMRSKKVALRSEKRQAIGDAKNTMKIGKLVGKTINDTMGISAGPKREFSMPRLEKPMIPSTTPDEYRSNEMKKMKDDFNTLRSKNK